MAFTKRNKAAVKALVSCHETGKPVANYSAIVVLKDDAGITYGAHQATHKSGSLYKIVKMYCDMSNSALSKKLDPYVAGFKNPALRHKYAADKTLKKLLVEAGAEPAMRFAQDKVFEVNYLEPAIQAVLGSGWSHPLTLAVVYDSMIQGGWTKVRDRVKGANEKVWIKNYVAARRKWLLSSSRQVVRNSVYRMATFEKLIANDNWDLDTPFIVHGVRVNDDHLAVWIAADNPNQGVTETGEPEEINIGIPAPNYFVGNTEGIADDDEAGGSWDDGIDVDEVEVEEPVVEAPGHLDEETDTTEVSAGEVAPENAADVGEPEANPGEPAPPVPAQEGEAIVGGRPQDNPIIVDKPTEAHASGWRTWPTTVTATLGGMGLSVGGIFTSLSGMELSPTTQMIVGWAAILGIVIAAGYGLFYLISRAVATNVEKKRAHEIAMKELELRANPAMYNVKLDRRGDTRNLTASGLPKVEQRTK